MGVNNPKNLGSYKKITRYVELKLKILKEIYMPRDSKKTFRIFEFKCEINLCRISNLKCILLYFYNLKLISRTKPSTQNSFTQRFEKYILLNLVETLYRPKLPQKQLRLYKKITRQVELKLKILKEIYMLCKNEINLTRICIFMRNSFMRGNHH